MERSTVHQTMESLRTSPGDSGDTCVVQTSDSVFDGRREPAARHIDFTYRQMWLYAMRHYPQMPRDPKRQDRLAKAQNAAADECVVSDMASHARRLGFRSAQIDDLARKPDCFSYDADIFNTLIDRIVGCFAAATPRDASTPPRILIDRPVKVKARCGHPTMRTLEHDRPLLFVDHMHAADVPDRVTNPQPFLRRGATADLSGTVPMSPLFVPENRPMDESSEARGQGYTVRHPPDGGLDSAPPVDRSPGSVAAMVADERPEMLVDGAVKSTAEPRSEPRRSQAEMEQRAAAQLAAERDRIQREAGERAAEAQAAETARLQQIAEDMARRA
ncbi:hypothetical protein ACJ73_03895 [Blastomyces percursus]|uniref:Uncharacterized protein n=1 Tax=Blastomyces percursus TaxID=1658174 RepID=A0A1J9R9S9_9EURO|nr:hypothetical protein ACJ73_03895 [Blastomyces percursus]